MNLPARTSASLRPLALAAFAISLAACGAKGPILPPVSLAAKPTTDLTVRQQGSELVLQATYPKTTVSGVAMPELEAVEIYRYIRPFAPAASPSTSTPAASPATGSAAAATNPPAATPSTTPGASAPSATTTTPSTVAKPTPPDPREFALAAEKALSLRGSELAAVTTGDTLELRMPLPQPLPPDRQAWTLAIRLISKGGERSELSNQVTLAPTAAPTAPTGLKVTPKENGIEIAWTPVEAPLLGCLIYRREAQNPSWGNFLHGATLAEGSSFLDTTAQYGHRYVYTISAAASMDPRIESPHAGEQEVDYQDRFAPAPPVHLLALAEARRVRLVWERSPSSDATGYVVFRQDPGGEFHRLNTDPIPALEFSDSGLVPRIDYRYRVAAVDKAGNLGEAGEIVSGSPTGQR